VAGYGGQQRQIASTLNAAYADGLLSDETLSRRLDQLFNARVIDPIALIGDLAFRRAPSWRARVLRAAAETWQRLVDARAERASRSPLLLMLDWSGGADELVIGRHHACDVVLSDPSVSRRHARLVFRDGTWVVQDLESTNGTAVNGVVVGRCGLRAGDRLRLGDEELRID
jgi:hypothetical protein